MKTVIIPETTFTGNYIEAVGAYAHVIEDLFLEQDALTVKFDNVIYNANKRVISTGETNENQYGGVYDAANHTVDFSVYPFCLDSLHSHRLDNPETWATGIFVQDGNEHTIEVYTGGDEPVVTKKYNNTQILQLDERLIIFDETTGDVVTFDGENWQLGSDNFGEAVMPSKYAVVGTAIVGKDIVGPSHTVGYAIVGTDEVGGI